MDAVLVHACPQRSLVAIEACVVFRRAYRENPFLLFFSFVKDVSAFIVSQVYREEARESAIVT